MTVNALFRFDVPDDVKRSKIQGSRQEEFHRFLDRLASNCLRKLFLYQLDKSTSRMVTFGNLSILARLFAIPIVFQ